MLLIFRPLWNGLLSTVCIQDVDAATSSRIALEKQLENLEAEIEFLKRIQGQVAYVYLFIITSHQDKSSHNFAVDK